MTDTIRHITQCLWQLSLSAMLAAVVGCTSADEPQPVLPGGDTGSGDYSLGMYIELGDASQGSTAMRSTPAGDYDPGTDFENYIHLSGGVPDLRVYLLDTDDYLICAVDNPEVLRLSSTPTRKTYELRFDVDSLFRKGYDNKPFKLLMLANHYGRYPQVMPGISRLEDIVGQPATLAAYGNGAWPAELTADSRIPMFGIVQFAGVQLKEGGQMTMLSERLHLLRALAKVEVTDSPQSEDAITRVAVTRHNVRYAMSPSGVNHQDDYVKYSYDADYVATLTVPAASETADAIAMETASDGKFVTYLPEYRNTGRPDAERAMLRIWYSDGAHFDIDFKYYSTAPAGSQVGDIFDIRRNYYYKFAVKRSVVDASFEVDVLPYGEVILKPGFGIDPENP